MQVFKLFFQIMRANKINLFMYLIITVAISLLFVKSGAMTGLSSRSEDVKPSIAIYDNSKTAQSEAFVKHLEKYTKVSEISADKLEDALFYRQIAYALYIPEDYAQQVESNQKVFLEKKVVDNAAGAYLIDQYIDSYLSALQGYYSYMPDASFAQINEFVEKDFSNEVDISIKMNQDDEQVQMYFNFFGYTFMCCLIGGIGFVMFNLSKREIRRRNVVAPMTNFSMNLQLVAAYIVFSLLIFAVATIFAYVIFPSGMSASFAPYMLLNMLVYLVPCLGLAFLIGSTVKNLEVQNGVANVLCLAMAFLGGSFVPQEIMSAQLLKIVTFTPNYWYVKSNDLLFGLQNFDWENIKPIFFNMGVMVLFGLAFVSIALVLTKQQNKNIK